MRKCKRILSILLAVCLILALLPSYALAAEIIASGECGAQRDNLTWTLDSTGTLTISGTGAMADYDYNHQSSDVPWLPYVFEDIKDVRIETGVTSIGDFAFINCHEMTSVSISDSVTSIGDCAFAWCKILTSVTLSDSVTSIGNYVFEGCYNLTNITIPDGITSIGDGVFSECRSLTNVTIPNGVTSIGNYVFEGCYNLTNITIPDSITSIGDGVFSECRSLTNVTIPNGVTSIGYLAFCQCYGLTNVTIPNSVTSIGPNTFHYCSSLKNVTISNSVTRIATQTFYGCSSLTNVTIPDGVTCIEWDAFGDSGLTSVTIPTSVTVIGDHAFECDKLTDVYYSGTKAQWQIILVGEYNESLSKATIHYGSGGSDPEPSKTASITRLSPASGSIFNHADATADTRLRIFFDREVSNTGSGGRPELDFSVGTLEIHKVSDDSLVYQIQYGTEVSSWSTDGRRTGIVLQQATSALDYGTEYYVTMAAFDTGTVDRAENITQLMDELEFTYTDESIKYPNPQNNTIGYAIGSKNVELSSGESSSLVLVAIRGAGYGTEWGGNFYVGSGSDHAGFAYASVQVLDGLRQYLDSNKNRMLSNVKIWIVGYSRAAATANLVAKQLNNGTIRGIDRNDIFAFCFECPQNSKDARFVLSDTKYANIVNIVNPIDFVPKVAMSRWGYGRYGNTYYLPSRENTKDYKSLKTGMVSVYADLLTFNNNGNYPYASEYWGERRDQASTLDDFMNNLADEFVSPSNYVYNHEVNLMEIASRTLGGEGGVIANPGSFIVELLDLGSL